MPSDIGQAAVDPHMNDKRGSPRKKIVRTVHMGTGIGPSLECELKDLSATGARLGFNDPKCAPQEFLVRLEEGILRWCQVIWRSKTEIGIKFIGTPKSFEAKAKKEPEKPVRPSSPDKTSR